MNYFSSPPGEFRTPYCNSFHVDFGSVNVVHLSNYELLTNKPSINSVVLEGNLTAEALGLGRVYYDTTENWDRQADLVSEKGAIYIYSDHTRLEDDLGNVVYVAGIRIGDGSAYLLDLPFVADGTASDIFEHITNTTIHVTQEEKDCWNSKVSLTLDEDDEENLIFSTDCSIAPPPSPSYSSLVGSAIVGSSRVGSSGGDGGIDGKCFTVDDENYDGDVIIY